MRRRVADEMHPGAGLFILADIVIVIILVVRRRGIEPTRSARRGHTTPHRRGPPGTRGYANCGGNGEEWRTVSPDTARVSATYSRRRPVRSSGSPSTTAAGSSSTT